MKRKLLLIFTLFVAMIGTLAFAVACGGGNDNPVTETPTAGEEVGEYYSDVGGNEYLLTLTDKCEYTLELGGDPIKGNYVPAGENLTFKIAGVDYQATYFDDVVTITYDSVTYKFIRKIDYTITFNTDGGSAMASLTVRNGRTATKPATNPTKGNDVFVGWYTDKAFKSPYDWNETVTSSFKLYARFVTPIDPEFTVTFNVDGNESTFGAVQTVGHKVFGLPKPEKAGAEFAGWWVSSAEDASKLTYRYEEQELTQNTTLYAVWVGDAPLVSVEGNNISWTAVGSNSTYTLVIRNLTTNTDAYRGTTTQLSYVFDFSAANVSAGEYEISVQANNKVGRAYIINKALAKVSVFRVENNTLMWNAVDNAEKYILTIVCGKVNHHLEPKEILANQTLSYDFSECEMLDGKITFTVRAEASGFLASETTYVVKRTLDKASNISVDPATEMLSWAEVSNATAYTVVIKKDGAEVFNGDVAEECLPLKNYVKGAYDISVTPKARGWNSPDAATYTYTKSTIAAPKDVKADIAGNKITWETVTGAKEYEVTVGDVKKTVSTNEVAFGSDFVKEGVTEYKVTVRAIAENTAESSLASDEIIVRNGVLGGELHYKDGVLSWDPAFGVTTVYLTYKVGDGEAEAIETDSGAYEVAVKDYFTAAGKYTFTLSTSATAGDDALVLDVNIYKLSFVAEGADNAPANRFLATGDKVELPGKDDVTQFGYKFDNWYTAEEKGFVYNDSVYLDEKDRTLYAYWTPEKFKVSFSIGAYGISTPELEAGVYAEYRGMVQLPVPESNDPTKGFAGWYDSATGEIAYTNADGVIPVYFQGDDITVYAKWVNILSFSAVRDGNGAITGYTVSKSSEINLTNITTIHIPEKYQDVYVTEVIDFSACNNVTVFEIPDSIRYISIAANESAFSDCEKLVAIKIYDTNYVGDRYYSDDDGVLIYDNPTTGKRELRYYPAAREADTYDIPDGVEVLPANVIWGAENLVTLTIPASVTLIESQAVGYEYSFDCSLQTITFKAGSGTEQPLEIHEDAFHNTKSVKHLTLPTRITDLNFYTIFGGGTGSSSLKPQDLESLNFVGQGGLYLSTSEGAVLKSLGNAEYELIYFPMGVEEFTSPQGYNVTSIGENAVRDNTDITSIVISASVTSIGAHAFDNCENVTTITFNGAAGDMGLTIDEYAFYGVGGYSGPTEIELPGNLVKLGAHAFGDTYIEKVTLNSGAEIADGAFNDDSGDSEVETLVIGKDVKDINFKAVFGTAVSNIEIDENNPNYWKDPDSDIIYNKDKTEVVWLDVSKLTGTFEIADGVKRIGASTFAGGTGYYDPKPKFTALVIPASVEYIGDEAFYGISSLETVTFKEPEAGQQRADLVFGNRVFSECDSLTEFTFPEGTKSIGMEMFTYCDDLTTVNFPKSLETIVTVPAGTSLYGSAISAKFGMFIDTGSCPVSTITVAEGNTHYKAIDNVLYKLREETDEEGNTKYVEDELLYCASSNTVTEITIPNTVSYIWNRAFYSYSTYSNPNTVTSVKFSGDKIADRKDPDGNTIAGTLKIGDEAFYNSANLKSITLPVGTVSIGASAFYTSGIDSITIPYTVTSIYEEAFYSCGNLSKVEFAETPEGIDPVELRFEDSDSSYGVFHAGYGNNYLKDYTIKLPERTTYIGESAFRSCTIGGVIIPSTVTEIGEDAFYSSTIPVIQFAPDSKLKTIGGMAFYSCKMTEFTLPASVVYVGYQAFRSCTDLVSFTIEDNSQLTVLGDGSAYYLSVFGGDSSLKDFSFGKNSILTYIGEELFDGCTALTTITIPASIQEIHNGAFVDSGIKTVTFENKDAEGNDVKSKLHVIGEGAFEDSQLTEFTFPETDQEIILESKIFNNCVNLKTVHISSTVLNLNGAFEGCTGITAITVADTNPNYTADEAFLRNKVTKDVILLFGEVPTRYEIPSGSTQIAASAFYGKETLQEIFIPRTVMRIGNFAFKGCINLKKVEFETGSALNYIGNGAFEGCTNLSDIDFTKTAQLVTLYTGETSSDKYTSNTFKDCTSLTSVDLSKTRIATIPTNTFAGCTNLESIKFPRSLTAIDSQMSYSSYADTVFGNTKITDLDLRNTGVVKLPQNFFKGSTMLKTIQVAPTTQSFGTSAFEGCTALSTLDFTACGALTEIGEAAFKGCSNLTSVQLSTVTTRLKVGAFADCTALKTFGMDYLQIVEYQVFNNTGFETVTLPGSVTSWGEGLRSASAKTSVFGQCANLKEVIFGYTMKTDPTWTGYMFSSCPNLKTITFQQGCEITHLANYMFENCTGLEKVKLPATLTANFDYNNGVSVFANCTNLKEVDLSELTVTALYSSMFTGCKAFTSFKFPDNLTSIPFSFSDCENLSEVVLPSKATSIPNYMFENCKKLTHVDIPEGVTSLGTQAFMGSGITSISLPATLQDTGSYYITAAIGTEVFKDCTALEEVTFAQGTNIGVISNRAFSGCTSLTKINNLPTTITTINEEAFKNCAITEITLPQSLTIMLDGAFEGSGVKTVTIACGTVYNSDSSYSKRTPARVFKGCLSLDTVTVTGEITALGESWFEGCTALKTVTLNDKVTTLGDYAFKDCALLDTINVDNVTGLGYNVFEGCTAIFNDESRWTDGVFYLGNILVAFDDTKIKAAEGIVTIKEGVTAIPTRFFTTIVPAEDGGDDKIVGSAELKEIKLPKTLKLINDNAFQNCAALHTVTGLEDTEVTDIPEYAFSGCIALTSFTIPSKVTWLHDYSFEGSGLVTITIPKTVTLVGEYAFANCKELTTATIEGYKAPVTEPGTGADSGVAKTDAAAEETPKDQGITQLSSRMFANDVKLQTVKLSELVTTIGQSAFENCEVLDDINLENVSATIGLSAFRGCVALNSVELSEKLVKISDNAFENTGFTEIGDWLANVTILGDQAFKDCAKLTKVTLPAKLKDDGGYSNEGFGPGVFEGCVLLDTVTFPEESLLTILPEATFKGCTALKTITIPKEITYIGESCFENSGITSFDFSNILTIDTAAFKGCTGLTEAKLSDKLVDYSYTYSTRSYVGLGSEVFSGCTSLTTVTIPNNEEFTELPKQMFYGCVLLDNIDLTNTYVVEIGESCFEGCSALSSITFNAKTTKLDKASLKDTTSLQTVDLKSLTSLNYINASAFENSGITSLVLPELASANSWMYIYGSAFANCTNLKKLSLNTKASLSNGDKFIQGDNLDLFEFDGDISLYERLVSTTTDGAKDYLGTTVKTLRIKGELLGEYIAVAVNIPGVEKVILEDKFNSYEEEAFATLPDTVQLCFMGSEEDVKAKFEAKKPGSWEAFLATLPEGHKDLTFSYQPTADESFN